MKYVIELEHDDFVLLTDVLKEAQKHGVITWARRD
jgi:hypothetical protein